MSKVLMQDNQLQLSDGNGHEEEMATRSLKVGIYQPIAQEEGEANQGGPAILVTTQGETTWPHQSTTLAENDGPPLEGVSGHEGPNCWVGSTMVPEEERMTIRRGKQLQSDELRRRRKKDRSRLSYEKGRKKPNDWATPAKDPRRRAIAHGPMTRETTRGLMIEPYQPMIPSKGHNRPRPITRKAARSLGIELYQATVSEEENRPLPNRKSGFKKLNG
ncbi:hypothetical protein BC827DRAFT_1159059 [Russula dissimulans]|nr:hypothetical protein BC827DRAFT_1159059 [Russula dissimulans]